MSALPVTAAPLGQGDINCLAATKPLWELIRAAGRCKRILARKSIRPQASSHSGFVVLSVPAVGVAGARNAVVHSQQVCTETSTTSIPQ
jgi:hypothetical protein